MFTNYLKIAFRNLIKFKSFSIINIFGLAIGIASCVLIMLYVTDELSYDKFYKNSDRIYRIHTEVKIGDNESKMAVSPAMLAEAMVNEIPEVEKAVRLRGRGAPVFKYGEKVFSEESILWVDSTFFDVFSFDFVEGSKETALLAKDGLVITESMRNKYFGEETALGKVIIQDFETPLHITGVIRDFPYNSHFRLDFMANLASVPPHENDSRWMASNFFTYVLLKENTDLNNFQNKLDAMVLKYAAPQIESFTGTAFEEMTEQGSYYKLKYQLLTDIHLHSNLLYELDVNSDISYIYIFSIIAFVILIIACINFVNLSTARSTSRAKEVGIRKTLGSNKIKLIAQFLIESVLVSVIAVMLALVLINLSIQYFNDISGKTLSLTFTDNFIVIPALILFSIIIGIAAGIYPAFLLTSFNPVKTIKGDKQFKGKSSWLRNGLVVFQFAVSVILFIGTLVVENQLSFMQNKKLGYDKERLIIIEKTNDLANRFESFKSGLLRNSSILNVSNHNTIPGRGFGNTVYRMENDESSGNYQMMIWFADYDLIDTYNIEMAEGRYFSEEFLTDSNAVVINEAAMKAMGLKTAVGKRLYDTSGEVEYRNIVGVVKDFHYESMHTPVRPLIIYPNTTPMYHTSVRIAGGDISQVVKDIEDIWDNYSNGQTFQYVFMDDEFNRIYSAELKTGELFTSFSLLAMSIACLGLFGLSAFITMQKTKEIGIRKVMGASIHNILYQLVKEFTKWVLIANIIAWPISYWMMSSWLEGFAYRVDVNYYIFIVSGAVSFIVALFTVSSQVIKAASKNPVLSLKYE